jgi:hypothetical protein
VARVFLAVNHGMIPTLVFAMSFGLGWWSRVGLRAYESAVRARRGRPPQGAQRRCVASRGVEDDPLAVHLGLDDSDRVWGRDCWEP